MTVVIFKAIEKCNSNCIYCDVVKKKQNSIMSLDLLELSLIRIDAYLQENINDIIELTWHGGEVCLLKPDYFKTYLEFEEKICRATKDRIQHMVQSNLTLITQEHIDLFKQMGIDQVGSSFDPLPNIRGFGKNRDSDAYNRRFMNGVRLLEKNNMGWGVIYVVHRGSLDYPLEIWNFLNNLSRKMGYSLNKVHVYGEDKHNLDISADEYADFLGTIFKKWWSYREHYPNVKPFASITKNYLERRKALGCEMSGMCANKWVYIGPTGETSQCGRSGDYDYLGYGNIRDHSLSEILNHPFRDDLFNRNQVLANGECSDCRFWGICHGGCPLDAYAVHGDIMHRSTNCEATMAFLENHFEPVTGYKADFKPMAHER